MDDLHSRAYGLAHSAIITELLRSLTASGVLSPDAVRELLTHAGVALAAKGTDVAAAATEHVRLIGEPLGIAGLGDN